MQRRLLLIVLLLMMASMTYAQDNPPETSDEPIMLASYASDTATLLRELELQGFIPSGAEAVFNQNSLTYSGDSPQFSNFGIGNDAPNVIIGTILDFAPQAEEAIEFCGVATNAQSVEESSFEDDSNVTTIRLSAYVTIAIDSQGMIVVFERDEQQNSALVMSETDVDMNDPVYLLALIIDDSLTVFANGEAVISEVVVTLPAGSFAFLYAGMDDETSCSAETLFAYTIADDLVSACTVSTETVINQRAGPSTDFERVSQLQASVALEAVGQTVGADGFTWWLLEDDSWVRDDVVDTVGFCLPLPEIDFDES